MKKLLVRVAIWLGVASLIAVEVGACMSVGGQAENNRPTINSDDIQLNQ